MSRREEWTPEQREVVERLRAMLPARAWWLFVAPPKAKCAMRNGLLMGCNHSSWRALMPPCDESCRCTVWAMTSAEARAVASKRKGSTG